MLIPEIHYLDSLDLGKDSPPGHIVPRFAAYNDGMVSKVIKRDIILKNRLPFPTYGKLKIHDPHSIRYVTIESTTNRIDTAFHVLHIMRNWDAKCLVNPASSASRDLRKVFLANLLSFTSNEAILPENVTRFIKALRRN
ncbi:hypothetical protein ZWY2020_037578 [Hordeum vulgare]|nr:hypothetical protein ZWY2020_037578 [Hordeum vulgare]